MQALRPIALAISWGRTDSVKNSGGVLWNGYAVQAPENAKNPITIMGSPGQKLFSQLQAAGNANARAVCDAIELNDLIYVVTRRRLYSVDASGTVVVLGTFPSDILPLARMATNGTDVIIVDGVRVFHHAIGTPGVTDITGESEYFPSASVTYLDGYFVFEAIGTGQFFHTELNSIEVDPLSLSTAEAYPDHALCVKNHRRNLWVFGEESIEIYYNAGGTASAFGRIEGAAIGHGIAGPYAVAHNEEALAYLSADGVVHLTQGLIPAPISTDAVHDAIRGRDWSSATMLAYVQDGHPMFQLSVETVTLVFDMRTGLWHGLRDEVYGRHRATCVVNAFGKIIMGDVLEPQLRELDLDAFDNMGQPLVLDIITPPIHADQRQQIHSIVEVELDTGEGGEAGTLFVQCDLLDYLLDQLTDGLNILTGIGETEEPPTISMAFSDDDGKTWSDERDKSMGFDGQYDIRPQWRRLGATRGRRYRFRISAPVRRALVSRAWLQVR